MTLLLLQSRLGSILGQHSWLPPGLLSQSFQSYPNRKGQITWREDRSEGGSSCIKDWGVMGFGGDEGGKGNLINNKSPSGPQSRALCLIAPYWFLCLSLFLFILGSGTALILEQSGGQGGPPESNVIYFPSSSSFITPRLLVFFLLSRCLLCCTRFFGLSTVKVILKLLWTLSGCFVREFWWVQEIASTAVNGRFADRHVVFFIFVKSDGEAKD